MKKVVNSIDVEEYELNNVYNSEEDDRYYQVDSSIWYN